MCNPRSRMRKGRNAIIFNLLLTLFHQGGKGLLADQEDALYQLRLAKETAAKEDLEKEVRETQLGKFCATPFGVDIVGITEAVGLIGAVVGGKLKHVERF